MQDRITKFLAHNDKISVVCVNTTELVEKARKIHDLSPVATAAFGRLLTITTIMAQEMKNKTDKITIQIKGNGEIGTMLTTANNFPKVKGYVGNPYVDLPLNEFGKLDVGGAVGNEGYIHVIKDIGLKEPYIGIAPLTSGEIADDFTNYFVNSEQRQSAVALGVLVNKDGVKAAGGYLINPMPDATEEDIAEVEQAIFKAGAISKMLDENIGDNTYARDYADLARLKELADRCRTTVLLVHHLRKQYDSDPLNRVSGTAGMSGAADGTFILQREDRSSNYGTLFCTGRDIESKELKLQFDPMSHIWE